MDRKYTLYTVRSFNKLKISKFKQTVSALIFITLFDGKEGWGK